MPRFKVQLHERITSGIRRATIEVDADSAQEAGEVAIDSVEPKDWTLVKSSGEGYEILSVQEM